MEIKIVIETERKGIAPPSIYYNREVLPCGPGVMIQRAISAFDQTGERIIYRSAKYFISPSDNPDIISHDQLYSSFAKALTQYLVEQDYARLLISNSENPLT